MTLNLPHSKLALVMGEPVIAPRDATEDELEAVRQEVERQLNLVTARAYQIVGADISRAMPLEFQPVAADAKPGLAIKGYRAALSLARPVVPLILSHRLKRGKEDPARQGERFGIASAERPQGRLVWVHAASVGETNVALPVISELLKTYSDIHVLLTTGTTTSAALAQNRISARTTHQYIPLDVKKYVAAFLDHWQPDLGIFTESEIWPNLVMEAKARGVPLALINARMSPRSMKRWRRFAMQARPLFARFDIALAQNAKVAHMLKVLGAPNVINSGNLKIDAPAPPSDDNTLAQLRQAAATRSLFLAASTHLGEDRIIADAHKIILAAEPDALLIIVPRHPERGPALQNELETLGFRVSRRSEAASPAPETQIYIADTLGELGTFYALSPVAFIGGSLIERGGQNPIEAVRHGAAVLTGPSHYNFADAYSALLDNGGAIEVTDAETIAKAVRSLQSDPALAAKLREGATHALKNLSGALDKTLAALKPFLDQQKVDPRAAKRT